MGASGDDDELAIGDQLAHFRGAEERCEGVFFTGDHQCGNVDARQQVLGGVIRQLRQQSQKEVQIHLGGVFEVGDEVLAPEESPVDFGSLDGEAIPKLAGK